MGVEALGRRVAISVLSNTSDEQNSLQKKILSTEATAPTRGFRGLASRAALQVEGKKKKVKGSMHVVLSRV